MTFDEEAKIISTTKELISLLHNCNDKYLVNDVQDSICNYEFKTLDIEDSTKYSKKSKIYKFLTKKRFDLADVLIYSVGFILSLIILKAIQ